MSEAKINLSGGFGPDNRIVIDGVELSCLVKTITIHKHLGGMPEITLVADVQSCEILSDGTVKFNHIAVSDEVSFEVYKTLERKYGKVSA